MIVFMCCVTSQCQFPPQDGSPTCVCCNKTLAAGKADAGNWKPVLFDYTAEFKDTFWCYYLCCAGYGFSGLSANGRPLYASVQKQLCVKQAMKLAAPIQEGVFCSGVETQLCCWTQCQFPPAPGNPGFKCCGFPKKGSAAKPMGYGKPGQVEMA